MSLETDRLQAALEQVEGLYQHIGSLIAGLNRSVPLADAVGQLAPALAEVRRAALAAGQSDQLRLGPERNLIASSSHPALADLPPDQERSQDVRQSLADGASRLDTHRRRSGVNEADILRHRAEERLSGQPADTCPPASDADAPPLPHARPVHPLEPEPQHEALSADLKWSFDPDDFAPVGYFTLDRAGVIRQVNLTGASLLGVERPRLVDRRFREYVAEADQPAFEVCLQQAFGRQGKAGCEVTLGADGAKPRVVRLEAVASAAGQACHLAATDITDYVRVLHAHQQAEAALQAERDFAEQMLKALPQGILRLNADWKIEFANPAIERQWGYAPAALLGHETLDFTHPDDRSLIFQFREQRLRGEISQGILRHQRADGSVEHDLVTGAPLMQQGRLRGVIVVVNDLTDRLQKEATLRASEQTLGVLLDSIPETAFLTDTEGVVLTMNAAGAARFGRTATACVGTCIYDQLPPATAQVRRAAAAEAIRTARPVQFEDQRAGRIIDNRIHPIVEPDGTVKRVAMLGIDVTVRKQAEETLRQARDELERRVKERTTELTAVNTALRASEERYRILVETSPDAILLTDLEGKVLMANGQAARLYGCAQTTEMEGGPILNLVGTAERPRIAASLLQAVKTGHMAPVECPMVKRNGAPFAGEITAALIREAEGQPPALIHVLRDITPRKEAEAEQARLLAEVQAANAELHHLSRRLVAVQEDERRAIGRELHDEVGQALTGLRLMLDTLSPVLPEAIESLQQARALAVELASRVRDLSLNLRPSLLDDLGLLPTLIWHFQRYRTQTKVQVAFEHSGLNRRFRPEVETAAYRLVQEALTNVARHAKVETVTVRSWADADRLYVQIQDEGVGFDEPRVKHSAITAGLSGMRERVTLLDGEFIITTAPSAGTTVWAALPL